MEAATVRIVVSSHKVLESIQVLRALRVMHLRPVPPLNTLIILVIRETEARVILALKVFLTGSNESKVGHL